MYLEHTDFISFGCIPTRGTTWSYSSLFLIFVDFPHCFLDKVEGWRGWILLWYIVRTFVNVTMYTQYNNK
jgi:hypothetical protein